MLNIPSRGPKGAKILIVGDIGSKTDFTHGPLSNSQGQEFTKMLHEAGIIRTECLVTLAYPQPFFRPKVPTLFGQFKRDEDKCCLSRELMAYQERLFRIIDEHRPNVIISLEMLPLFMLTGHISPSKWRGSLLETPEINGRRYKVIPTYHPDQVFKLWSRRYQVVNDLKRAKGESFSPEIKRPDYLFHLEPSFKDARDYLSEIRLALTTKEVKISHDFETINKHISCSGLGVSPREAMCIPFVSRDKMDGYFSLDEEAEIVRLHKEIITHPNCQLIGQNWLYDVQFTAYYWGFIAKPWMDTMIGWHTLYPGEPKSLDFLSSMLCDFHEYWKDDVKDYTKYPADEHQYWKYNAKDCVITWEAAPRIDALLTHANLQAQFQFLMRLYKPVLAMMLRGVRIDTSYKKLMSMDLWELMTQRETWFEEIVDWRERKKGASPWYRSPKQLASVLYEDLGLPVQKNKKTKGVTTDDDALKTLQSKEPAVRPLLQKLQEYRSLGIFKSNFADASLDRDKRIRCSFGIAGPETFRFNSKESVFGTGTNLQTIPKGNQK